MSPDFQRLPFAGALVLRRHATRTKAPLPPLILELDRARLDESNGNGRRVAHRLKFKRTVSKLRSFPRSEFPRARSGMLSPDRMRAVRLGPGWHVELPPSE